MSWRSIRSSTYNRTQVKEETSEILLEEEYNPFYEDFCNSWYYRDSWWDDQAPGSVANMQELHQMRLLTLLRKLNILTAKDITKYKGW